MGGELFYGDMTDGGGVTVEMTAAEKYTIKATQIGETGEYELAIGKPSSSVDITGKYITPDAFTFAGQKKSYTFRVAQSGQYKITLGNLPENAFAEVFVYSQLGEKIAGTSSLGSGKSVVCELREGQGYQIRMMQQSGIGEYTLTIVKE